MIWNPTGIRPLPKPQGSAIEGSPHEFPMAPTGSAYGSALTRSSWIEGATDMKFGVTITS